MGELMNAVKWQNAQKLEEILPEVWKELRVKVDRMIEQIGDKSPHVAKEDGVYDDMRVDWWTSGFWPGILWIMHEMTGKEHYKEAAWEWDGKFEQKSIIDNNFHHDVGFQYLPTAVIKHKLTGDKDGLRRGLQAANFLAGRFNIAGNFIRAWNQEKLGWSIVDSTMNLSILFWAAEMTGDPRFEHIGRAQADTVVQKFIREDGSVNHILSFDPKTGELIESLGGQGAGPQSAWSRGAAWALHGLVNVYRFTEDTQYLKAAQRVANYFLACLPEDYVAHWDFRADASLDNEPRDTSAASCAASGLIDLAAFLPPIEGAMYLRAAERMLLSLTVNYGTWDKPENQAILLEGTGNKPANSNVNVSLIYGDYYYVEALAKLQGWKQRIF
ncbi:Unsaturated chondroitin disaccharide hydrolase [Paenibacillus allorhizoplanae]|uniref:Unsaturated chondroitin disaccharide hydrolase n=2 Tax=Paenibacillus allorhizoplanae TaxID=2905648 RepID=A0ABN8FS83_9BACL|nr:glycoside hydrolase family 88 protein [Paenibacillus allorhizoplanae]CAH1191453.1 Unsaturated chondroitin disaccharide hydrolase [Paenibacillus allorhizoplanae]